MSYRQLIRNLRKGTHLTQPMRNFLQSPPELEAVAALLLETGLDVEVCQPGTTKLPTCKAYCWRLSCYIAEKHKKLKPHFELSIVGGNLTIRKVVKIMDGVDNDKKPLLGYTGHPRNYPNDHNNHIQVELADPNFPQQAKQIMEEWAK